MPTTYGHGERRFKHRVKNDALCREYYQGKEEQLQKIRQLEGTIVFLYIVQTYHRGMLHGVDCYNNESRLFMQASILNFYLPFARVVMSALV